MENSLQDELARMLRKCERYDQLERQDKLDESKIKTIESSINDLNKSIQELTFGNIDDSNIIELLKDIDIDTTKLGTLSSSIRHLIESIIKLVMLKYEPDTKFDMCFHAGCLKCVNRGSQTMQHCSMCLYFGFRANSNKQDLSNTKY